MTSVPEYIRHELSLYLEREHNPYFTSRAKLLKIPDNDFIKGDTCQRAYWLPCPRQWASDGSICYAPPSWEGEGPKDIHIGTTPSERETLSFVAGAAWPCERDCEALNMVQDFTAPCPLDWTYDREEDLCIAHKEYVGPCASQLDVRDHTPSLNRTLARLCDVSWPCLGSDHLPEQRDSCPPGWRRDASSCVAPEGYGGPCPSTIPADSNATLSRCGFSVDDSNANAKAGVEVLALFKKGLCRSGLEPADCPVDWTFHGSYCQSSPQYEGPCSTILIPSSWSNANGVAAIIVDRCDVSWDCKVDNYKEGDTVKPDSLTNQVDGPVAWRQPLKSEGEEVLNQIEVLTPSSGSVVDGEGTLLHSSREMTSRPFVYDRQYSKNLWVIAQRDKAKEKVDIAIKNIAKSVAFLDIGSFAEESTFSEKGSVAGRQDFSKECPLYWSLVDGNCHATNALVGTGRWPHAPCVAVEGFPSLSPRERMIRAGSCRLTWPEPGCDEDFIGFRCPEGWDYEKLTNLCHSFKGGPCSGVVDFTFFSPLMRRRWAQACRERWPCHEPILIVSRGEPSLIIDNHDRPEQELKDKDFSLCKVQKKCPIDMVDIGEGRCRTSEGALHNLSDIMTEENVKQKNYGFVCDPNYCSRFRWFASCPIGWSPSITNGLCIFNDMLVPLPQPIRRGDCVLDFPIPRTAKEKVELVLQCGVSWPCEGNCDVDWTIRCPDGWELKPDGDCISPSEPGHPNRGICALTSLRVPGLSAKKVKIIQQAGETIKELSQNLKDSLKHYKAAIDPQGTTPKHIWTWEMSEITQKMEFSTRCRVSWPCKVTIKDTLGALV